MPSIEEIKTALGKMRESSKEPSRELSNINENVNPFSEKLFSPIEQLQCEIRDKDNLIERLKKESTDLTNQVSMVEEEKYTILEKLEKSRWLESKVALATKKVYEDKVKSIINVNADSKIIPVLTEVARRKQGNQKLNWGNWLKIPENKYLFQINEDIAKKVFEDTNTLIDRSLGNKRTRGGGGPTELVNNSSLTFDRTNEEHVTTEFDPIDYNLNQGFTVSFWVRPDELGTHRFAIGRRMAAAKGRFTFGLRNTSNLFIGVGNSKKTGFAHGFEVGTWYHLAITYAGNSASPKTLKGYIDGEEIFDTTTSWPDADDENGIPIYFGARNAIAVEGYNLGWSCGLDEVAIFDEVKSIGTLYTGAKPSDLSGVEGLVGYWRFEKGSGTTVEDLSGNGNHGTFAPISGDTTALPTWSSDIP